MLTLSLLCACIASLASGANSQDVPAPAPSPPEVPAPGPPSLSAPIDFLSDEAILAPLELLTTNDGAWIQKQTFGKSALGAPLEAWTIAKPNATARPTMLIVGGLDGVHLFSAQCAVAAAQAVLAGDRSALEHGNLIVIPVLNPDARALAHSTRAIRSSNATAMDDDRDGAMDEDAAQDVNGDGLITMMRLPARVGRAPTHLIDSVDARIVRTPDPKKHEHATHEYFVEGRDLDGDGRVAEDSVGGTDLDRNFPHRWPEFATDAGAYPLSAVESLAFAEFIASHPEITTALIFGVADTLAEFPESQDKDSSGSTPSIYHTDDHASYKEIAKAWKDGSRCEKAIDIAHADLAGSLVLWLANHRGIAAVTTSAHARPDAPKAVEGAPPVVATGDAEQQAWLEYSDRVFAGAGFIAWQPFQHPELGPVEIGGWRPFFREQPSALDAAKIATAQGEGAKAILALLPRIELGSLTATPLADGLLKVDLVLVNAGGLPTTTKMDTVARARPPILVRTSLAPSRLLSGKPVERIDRIAAGGSARISYTMLGEPGERVQLRVEAPGLTSIEREIVFPPASGASR